MGGVAGDWNEDRELILRTQIAQKASATEIAALLNQTCGTHFSRNAIIGKAHRLGLAWITEPDTRTKKQKRMALRKRMKAQKAWAPKPLAPEDIFAYEGERAVRQEVFNLRPDSISLVDLLECHCRWPLGEVRSSGFGFCGKAHVENSYYCQEHTAASLGLWAIGGAATHTTCHEGVTVLSC